MKYPKAVEDAMASVRVDTSHDVPYVGGSSRDGSVVYIDRHLRGELPTRVGVFQPIPFIVLHEVVEKRLALSGWRHGPAHMEANRVERAAVIEAGIPWDAYDNWTYAAVKGDAHERIVKPPKDLDLTPYVEEGDDELVMHLIRKGVMP